MAGTPPRDETVVRLHDIVMDKVMTVLRGPDAYPFDLLSDYFTRFNSELDQPLRMSATIPDSTRLLIKSNRVPAGDGGAKQTPPIDDIFSLYPDTSINFLGGAVSGTGTVTTQGSAFAFPSAVSGQYFRMAAVYQSTNNAVDTAFSAASASVSGLTNAGDIFVLLDGLPIGYVDLQCIGVSSFASPGSTQINNFVGSTPTVFRFAAGGGTGGGKISDFTIKSVNSTVANIGKGYQELANGMVLVTGSGTTSSAVPANLAVTLNTVLGGSPAVSTTYWLYVDLQNVESPFTLTDNGRPVIRISAASNFALLTTDPVATNPIRYLPVGFIRTASDGSWNGTGSKFGSTPITRQVLDNRFFSGFQEYETTVSSVSSSFVVTHALGGKPQFVNFFYYDGAKTLGLDSSVHLLNLTDTQIEFSTLGLTFGGGQFFNVKALFCPAPGQNVSMATSQPEFGWYTDTSVSSVPHGLNNALDIKGMSLIEWDTVNTQYRVLEPTALVTYYNNTSIFFDWTGLSPSATLQYRLVSGGRTLPSSIPIQFGGFTKFVGLGPGSYATVAAAVAASAAGDSILVLRSYSISAEETINVSDIRIEFMPGIEVTSTAGAVGWRVTGSRVEIDGLDLTFTTAGTVTDGLRVEGNDVFVRNARVRTNNAGTTLTNAYTISAAGSRNFLSGSFRADAGSIITPVLDSGFRTVLDAGTGILAMLTKQLAPESVTIPSGYNLNIGELTIPTNVVYTVSGSMHHFGDLGVSGDLIAWGDIICH